MFSKEKGEERKRKVIWVVASTEKERDIEKEKKKEKTARETKKKRMT